MFEDAAAEVECRDAQKMTVTSAIMKGLVKALQEDINKVLPARDADAGRLKESLEEKDINTIWYVLSQFQT
jgi:AICAR transformylase/IMP cyclohydrolase PurH